MRGSLSASLHALDVPFVQAQEAWLRGDGRWEPRNSKRASTLTAENPVSPLWQTPYVTDRKDISLSLLLDRNQLVEGRWVNVLVRRRDPELQPCGPAGTVSSSTALQRCSGFQHRSKDSCGTLTEQEEWRPSPGASQGQGARVGTRTPQCRLDTGGISPAQRSNGHSGMYPARQSLLRRTPRGATSG